MLQHFLKLAKVLSRKLFFLDEYLFMKPGNWFGPLGALPRKARGSFVTCVFLCGEKSMDRRLIGATQPRSSSQVCQQSVNSSNHLDSRYKVLVLFGHDWQAANVFILDLFVVYALNILQKYGGIYSERCGDVCFFQVQ